MSEKLAILDAGAQYGKVIDRRVREQSVESDILPINTPSEELKDYKAIIISGGPQSVYGEDAPKYDSKIFLLNKPILGICYGMQLMNYALDGTIEKRDKREDGACEIEITQDSDLFKDLNKNQTVLMSHGDSADKLADGFTITAKSGNIIASIENKEKMLYGVQFHPEVDLTENGKDIIHNFLYTICKFEGIYTVENREQKAIEDIKQIVGDKKVLVLVSGGVDSTVCAALLNRALDNNKVYAVHIDNGFMRLDESSKVKQALENIGLNLKVIAASDDFYNATTIVNNNLTKQLKDTISPEQKRHIIGDTFMRVSQKVIDDLKLNPNEVYLAQGTLRPDLIESASELVSDTASTIKTHHNDTALVRQLREQGRVIEPLKDYHKDEVRELGKILGLPEDLVMRQPFPGPGLAVRIICAKEPYICDDFDEINNQLKEFLTDDIFATLLPIQTVGVQGDGRTYSYLVGLSGKCDWDILFKLAKEIPKKIHKVNRVVYIFGDRITESVKEITPTYPTVDVIEQLQKADNIVNEELVRNDLIIKLSQVPIISFPVNFGIQGNHSIAIRTFITNDFMTGRSAVPDKDISTEVLNTMVNRILKEVPGISRIVYDLTSKPPGTTEWE